MQIHSNLEHMDRDLSFSRRSRPGGILLPRRQKHRWEYPKSFAHQQGGGASYGLFDPSVAVTLGSNVTAGDCLIAYLGIQKDGTFAFNGMPAITDNAGNVWSLIATSPVQINSGPSYSWQILVYAALNCSAATATITATFNAGAGASWSGCLVVDEYSGVASAKAVDQQTFASTAYGSGLTSIASGSITIPSGEMLCSAGFCNADTTTFTFTSGFTLRENQNAVHPFGGTSLASFDNIAPSAGSYSNTVGVNTTPDSIHVVLISLAATAVSGPLVQVGVNATSATFATTVSASYPHPNAQSNLLIAVARVYEREDFAISDSQNNLWTIVYGATGATNYVLAYALNCKAGANTVTLVGNSGGSDVTLNLLVAEYSALNGAFLASSQGTATPGSSVNTGNVSVSIPPALLVSCFIDSTEGALPPVSSSPGTWRFQFSDPGFLQSQSGAVVLAEQYVSMAGSYDNVFTIAPSDELNAAILGFTVSNSPPVHHNHPHVFAMT